MWKVRGYTFIAVVIAASLYACQYDRPSLWELKCAACHDGQSVFEGKVLPGRAELRERYRDIDEFVSTSMKAPRTSSHEPPRSTAAIDSAIPD